MFPQLRLTPTRAAFARPGPHATAFPGVNAPMQPSDSLVPLGRRSGHPSPTAYPGAEVLFFTAAPVPPLTGATPETFLPRLPISRLSPEEKRGYPRCLGHPLRACRGLRPRRVRTAPRPSLGAVAVAFRRDNALGTRKHISFVATYPRPTHSRAYASPNPLPSPAQGSLPAGRAHPSPGGFRTRWMTNKVSWGHRILHFPLDQPCLVALSVSLMSVLRRLPTMGGLGRKFLHKLPDMGNLRNLESPFILWIQIDIYFLASTN